MQARMHGDRQQWLTPTMPPERTARREVCELFALLPIFMTSISFGLAGLKPSVQLFVHTEKSVSYLPVSNLAWNFLSSSQVN